ncbi:RNA 3'-terminal phosphate cyclase [Mycobacterium shimoidei]|uniref:RNA 3'-terminal phosphate cyclase n=1 Tax=Mycobacterium shimoidei TaxID=29313 RepID=UPI000A01DC50|nr:RNA 3'-terminal phosphate cyclase [Mycobacterium shimoidei]MCV7260841.1 RNA 3'-phosphate cyclase [Mycobacterium shimoidei]
MITIDGAQMSGSGTIVRYAVALAALRGEPVRVVNARQKRPQPGLRPQHMTNVQACAQLCGATVDGVEVGSRAFDFIPGPDIRGGSFEWDIGTSGSATMLALGVLPVACFAAAPVRARITGGLIQDFAPSPFHMQHVLAPLLKSMGVDVSLDVIRPGYLPAGGGIIELTVSPRRTGLDALELNAPGQIRDVHGVALSSHLADRQVSRRMASACEAQIQAGGMTCAIDRVEDVTAANPGACLAIWATSSTGSRLGADRAATYRRSSEQIGRYVAATFLEDVRSAATVDRHLADQLVLFCALAHGSSSYIVPRTSAHLETSLWLVDQFGAQVASDGKSVQIQGVGLIR